MAAKQGIKAETRQLLHLVFGGELTTLDRIEFSNLKGLDIVGIYPNYAEAYAAWRDAATGAWTTRICAISSCICTGCSTPRRKPALRPGVRRGKALGFSP